MKKTSIRELYRFQMVSHIFVILCEIITVVFITLNYNSFIESFGIIWSIVFLIFIIGTLSLLAISTIEDINTLLKDLKSLKNNDYISIIGKVLKFKKNINPRAKIQINNKPVIQILDTNEEIELFINDKIIIGETYKFKYLKNTKIAEVVEKISN